MTTQTTTDSASTGTAQNAAPRLAVWLELPQSRAQETAAPAAHDMARDSWYDPAAVYEEPERWDGMA